MQQSLHEHTEKPTGNDQALKDLILSLTEWGKYFWRKKHVIILLVFICSLLGFLYAWRSKFVYKATTSFVLESGGKTGGLSTYAGLASSLGVDLGSNAGGLFEGENILELYKSRSMISSALLSRVNFNGQEQLLIDRYIEFNNLREKWKKKPELNNIRFREDNIYSTPRQQLLHDSIMSQVVNYIVKGVLQVEKKDKKSNIIYVTVDSGDELFAKYFNQELVETVNSFYMDTKIKKNVENISILQVKTDSVRSVLSGSINRAAIVSDATPNQNPTRMAERMIPIQSSRVNTEISQATLGTLLQHLEMSKIALLKESPLLQIVDEPILPLAKKKVGKLIGIIVGGAVGGFLALLILVIRKIIRDALT